MVDYQDFAAKALHDETLTRSECQAVFDTPDEQLLGLLQAAFTVRSHYFGKTVRLQMLQNAKSGACQEDCHYCSQSAISTALIERYSLVPQQQMIEGARQAAASKAQRYCIVISGRSPLDREIDEIAGAVRAIKQEIPIQICCSLGLMNEQQAKRLKAAGVDRVNHNLNTSEAFHASICTTHTFQDRRSHRNRFPIRPLVRSGWCGVGLGRYAWCRLRRERLRLYSSYGSPDRLRRL